MRLLQFFVALTVGSALYEPDNFLADERIEGEFIVIFNTNLKSHYDHFTKVASFINETNIKHRYNINNGEFQGYAVKDISEEEAKFVSTLDGVSAVEPNWVARIAQTCNSYTSNSWGLSRSVVAGRIANPPQGTTTPYTMATNQEGEGIELDILDTGVLCTHTDFVGRCTFGFDGTGEGPADLHGHGTHVASTAGGTNYGLARRAQIVAVKVCNGGGSCPADAQLAGINYAAGRAAGRKVVGNMSIGSVVRQFINDALDAAVRGGLIMVVAAGNNNLNACNYSPASASLAFTVGSSDNRDSRSTFSNFGTCVKLFAPGTNINAAWIGSNTATRVASGTSMASPHGAGIAAKIWSSMPTARNTEVQDRLLASANRDLIVNPGAGSPNLLALNSC